MISKWKNNLLNLLKVGGLVAAIALGGASLGVAVKPTSEESTEYVATHESITKNTSTLIKSGALGLYGGFKSFKRTSAAKRLRNGLIKQEILGIPVGKDKTFNNINEITVTGVEKEFEILDLSKTMGNMEWILKQIKYPNQYTSKISMETLYKAEYNQEIYFVIEQKGETQFDNKQSGILSIQVAMQHISAVKKQGKTPAKAESWNFVFKLKKGVLHSQYTIGTFATSMPPIPNSEVFKMVLNEEAILDANLQILLWKKSGSAKPDGTDFDIAIMLNKRTGKVFIWAKAVIVIIRQEILGIVPMTITL